MFVATALPRGRLCTACRSDLLRLLRSGFCTESSRVSRRAPAYGPLRYRARDGNFRIWTQQRSYVDGATETETETSPLAVQEDSNTAPVGPIPLLKARLPDVYDEEAISFRGLHDQIAEAIKLAREQSASVEDIARLARQSFGEVLPGNVLDETEYKIYVRLYGEPEEIVDEDDVSEVFDQAAEEDDTPILLDAHGNILHSPEDEKVKDRASTTVSASKSSRKSKSTFFDLDTNSGRIKDVVEQIGGQVYEPIPMNEELDEDPEPFERQHPLTTLGKFATSPLTVFLPPKTFIEPVINILSNYSNKHITEMCHKRFGGPGLPDSALKAPTPQFTRQTPIPLDASQRVMSEMEANAFLAAIMPPVYASVLSVLTETRKRLGSSWLRGLLKQPGGPKILDVGAAGAGVLAWNEIAAAEWSTMFEDVSSIPPLPASKPVVLAGSDSLRSRAASLLDNTTFIPRLPNYVHLRDGPTLEDSRPAQQRQQFDVIIAAHSLYPLEEDYRRRQHIHNLWSLLSPNRGVLILLEKGVPQGFEAVAGAREYILNRLIASQGSMTYESPLSDSLVGSDQIINKDTGMIIAPCTNHSPCPMYTTPGTSKSRKDFCHFKQRFMRPPHLRRIMSVGHHAHADVAFSYLAVMKGDDLRNRVSKTWADLEDPLNMPVADQTDSLFGMATSDFTPLARAGFEIEPTDDVPMGSETYKNETAASLPGPLNVAASRIIIGPLKKAGHIHIDLCTPAGKIERWTVPRSFSKQAYRDARKSDWGDLWSLGAKTVVHRGLRLGKPEKETKQQKKARMLMEQAEDDKAEDTELMEDAFLDGKMEDNVELESAVQRFANTVADAEEISVEDEADVLDMERDLEVDAKIATEVSDRYTNEDNTLNDLHATWENASITPKRKPMSTKKLRALETRATRPASFPSSSPNSPEPVEPKLNINLPASAESSKPPSQSTSDPSSSSTTSSSSSSTKQSPLTRTHIQTEKARLLNTLEEAKSDPHLAAALSEWEAEYRDMDERTDHGPGGKGIRRQRTREKRARRNAAGRNTM